MTTGQFVGVGIEITVQDDEIVVISPIDDSPAMRAGIHAVTLS
jgi:carboxyl-terminal processing protease